jgi:hypothetical protein
MQMGKDKERLDKYHKAIREYIKNNPERTENQIVNAMHKKKICSKVTTLRKIDELIVMEEIKDLLKEGESGFHKFIINDQSEFNLINDKLLKMENFMNDIYEKFRNQFNRDFNEMPLGTVLGLEEGVKFISFIEHCFQGIFLFTLHDIFYNIESENDKQVLYNRVMQSMLKLSHLSRKGRDDFLYKRIEEVEKFIESSDFEFIQWHYGISNNSLEELISIMEKLK